MTKFPFFTMDNFDFTDKMVYLRIDINSPINPITDEILDDSRFKSYIYTINELRNSKTVIVAHQGRPGDSDFISLRYHALHLSKIIKRDIKFVDSLFGEEAKKSIREMKNGDIIMLENSRFYSEEVAINFDDEIVENTHIVKSLSPLFDYYIIDSFATIHRPQTTLTGFKKIKPNIAGKLMEREIAMLNKFKFSESRPKLAVLAGSKINDAIRVSKNFFDKNIVDNIIFGGVAANIFLWTLGYDIGKRNIDFITKNNKNYEELIKICRYLIEKYYNRIILPEDFILNPSEKSVNLKSKIPDNELIADIGMKSIMKFKKYIDEAKSIFLNGPMGMYEINEYSIGTREVFTNVAYSNAMKITGGGHTINAINSLGLSDNIDYISTGGGALINYLSGDSIPVIDSLIENKKIFGGS